MIADHTLLLYFFLGEIVAYGIPTTTEAMNYNSVILIGVVFITAAWWFIHARENYPGPKVMAMYIHEGQPVETPLEVSGLGTSQEKKDP